MKHPASGFASRALRLPWRGIGLVVLGLIIGFGGGYWYESRGAEALIASLQGSLMPVQESGSYDLVKPLLAYRIPEATVLGQYQSLKDSMQALVDHATATGNASRVSVYFRDLDTGRWLGIDQNDTYYPASLLKVPVLIAYYKEAETDPSILDETVTYETVKQDNPFDAPSTLTVGQSYTVEELIESMVIDSDNGATLTLLARINPEVLSSVYNALGITNPGDDSSTYQISNRTYALFFRVLYNATYLSPESSEKALKLLSEARFKDGLVAGVPGGTLVAHKFGEHIVSANGAATAVELHDCGVVYYPSHPYLLCVMTSAKDVPTASSIISGISQTAYAAIAEEYPATSTSTK